MSKRLLAASVSAAALLFASAAWADNNEAYVDQVGTGNAFTANQTGNSNKVFSSTKALPQHGNTNTYISTQNGDNNKVVATPFSGDGQFGNGNNVSITQSNAATATPRIGNNVASLQQSGTGNALTIGQTGDNNIVAEAWQSNGATGTITQNGNGNGHWSTNFGSPSGAYRAKQLVTFGFNGPSAGGVLNQTYDGTGNSASIDEEGDSNSFTIVQTGGGTNDVFTDTQTGNGNYVYSGQGGTRETSNVLQTGNNNVLLSYQGGSGTVSSADTGGSDNVLGLTQHGNTNWAETVQIGAGNHIDGLQDNSGGGAVGNQLYAYQNGTSNYLYAHATGDNNVVNSNQQGLSNIGYANQSGNNNTATINQHQ